MTSGDHGIQSSIMSSVGFLEKTREQNYHNPLLIYFFLAWGNNTLHGIFHLRMGFFNYAWISAWVFSLEMLLEIRWIAELFSTILTSAVS